jgi:hypothetical protein
MRAPTLPGSFQTLRQGAHRNAWHVMPARGPEGKELIMSDQSKALLRRGLEVVAVATAVALLSVVAASSALGAETKTFTGVKDCNQSPAVPFPGGFCLMTASSYKVLLGAPVYYTAPVIANGVLTSPVTLAAVDKKGSTATGECTFNFATQTGVCVYSSGTGKLAGFHATINVGPTSTPNVYSLTGTYGFDSPGR